MQQSPLSLSETEKIRYHCHLLLPKVGEEGQLKLKRSRVLIVGVGGLGSPASLYLAAAGVGEIGILDFDQVSLSNLQRQILFSSEQIGDSKVECAKTRLSSLNPEIRVTPHPVHLSSKNVMEIFSPYDLILDCTDNFSTRYLINDACVLLGRPNIYGALHGFDAQVSVFCHQNGPCYRCLFPEPPAPGTIPNCDENGVLGVLPGIVGTLQATEAIKLILGIGTPLIGSLLNLDTLEMDFAKVQIRRRTECVSCGDHPSIQSINSEVSASQELEDLAEIERHELTLLLADPEKLIQLVDVRTLPEFRSRHLEKALHIPLHELSERLDELDRNKETIVYCQHGVRSLTALSILKDSGFRNVRHLKRGLSSQG